LPNCTEFVVAYFGILKAGAIAVSVSPALRPEEATFLLRDSGAKAIFTIDQLAATLPLHDLPDLQHVWIGVESLLRSSDGTEHAADMSPEDPAAIVYSSGTTGFPKGAILSHGNVDFNSRAKQKYLGILPEDRLLLFLPLHHCFGQNAILNAGIASGASIVLLAHFDPKEILRRVVDDRVTMFFGVPAAFLTLFDQALPDQMQTVRYYFSAAAPLPTELESKWLYRFGAPIHQGYGLTETSPFVSYNHRDRIQPGSIGSPIEGVEMKIVRVDDGCDAGPGESGEILVRGPNVMLGYWNRPDATEEIIREGWFHTGDIGRQDESGCFFIEDRLKDMINVGGLKVYPAEVENILYRHAAVAEAAVYGVADPYLGEQVHASVVLRKGANATTAELVAHCRGHLANYKVPATVEFAVSLPKSPAGKVLKRVLRSERLATSPLSGELTGAEMETWLTRWLALRVQIHPESFDADLPFAEYGLDSMQAVGLAHDLGQRVGRKIPPTVVWQYSTPRALVDHLTTNEQAEAPDAVAAELARQLAEEIAAARQLL
jgi:long-chain acyl-CoA synthetase